MMLVSAVVMAMVAMTVVAMATMIVRSIAALFPTTTPIRITITQIAPHGVYGDKRSSECGALSLPGAAHNPLTEYLTADTGLGVKDPISFHDQGSGKQPCP